MGVAPLGGVEPDTGKALTDCIRDAIGAERGFSGDVISDLNGEYWRAQQWGTAQPRLRSQMGAHPLHIPATSIGDTGAASGALGICYAAQLFAQRVACSRTALVLSSSDDGHVACAVVRGAS